MLSLGFAAGLPLLLTGGTFSAYLRDLGVELAAIGFLSWVGMAYSFKVLWAPIVDRVRLPFLSAWLGRRRAWMLAAQVVIAAALLAIALLDPREQLWWIAVFAVLTAFAAATQDIAIDAYRIEAVTKEKQAAMAATYVTGYRVALLAAGAGALHIAALDFSGLFAGLAAGPFSFLAGVTGSDPELSGWSAAYAVMAALMAIGIITTLIVREPEVRSADASSQRIEAKLAGLPTAAPASDDTPAQPSEVLAGASLWLRLRAFVAGAIVAPFVEFFARFGRVALLVLAVIGVFRIADIFMGVMANPFYLDLGFTKQEIANIAAMFGLAMTLTGAALGGLLVARFGLWRLMVAAALLAPLTNLAFSALALTGPDRGMLMLAIAADNLSGGLAIAVFIAWLSSLTHSAYTATQYALFSSLMTLPGQFLAGFTGVYAEFVGWFWFFVSSAAIGVPTILLVLLLGRYAHPDRLPQPGRVDP
ncbi:MAG: AmpG family muropeptide MFS transporter [Thioalkalivibrionaceae bacterium]